MKMKILALGAVLAATLLPVNAQQPTQLLNLSVDNADVALIGEGLGNLPYNKVAPLMGKLQKQINDQTNPPQLKGPLPTNPEAK